MISASTGKEIIGTNIRNLIIEEIYGSIEAIPHPGLDSFSYNVLKAKTSTGRQPFYKSAYKLDTAKRYLKELCP